MKRTSITAQWTDAQRPIGRRLDIAPGKAGIRSLLASNRDAPCLGLDIVLPVRGVAGIWTPYGDRATLQKVVWKGRLAASPYWQGGLIAWVDASLRNRFALLTEPADAETEITWALDQAEASYRIHVEWVGPGKKPSRGIRFCVTDEFSHDLAGRLLDRVAPAPAVVDGVMASYEPSYCTWYAYHGALHQKEAEACARRARDLGFGAFILDDGWAYDGDQRVGASLGPWHRGNGDYQPSKRKFPDFGEHVALVKSMGLRYILWVAPFIVGRQTLAFRKLRKHLLPSWLDEGFMVSDPRSDAAIGHVVDALTGLLRAYPVDGFKVDYDYGLLGPGQTLRGLGAAYGEAARRIVESLRRINPAVEWNLLVTPFSREVTAAYRCVDVPFDPDSNRLFMANLAAVATRGALASDPALWRRDEPVDVVHRHLVPSLLIVPSVGAPIMDLPKTHLEAIRAWLGFYRRHQRILNHGTFRARWAAGDFQSFARRCQDRQVLAAFSRYPLEIDGSVESWVINAGHENALVLNLSRRLGLMVEDADGRRVRRTRALPAGLQSVDCTPGTVLRIGS